ncbi:hypothetical protein GCM10010972_24940 [Cellulomonas carbonis]|nr:hypothetical protein GCM10010972_24940 [Cellulomonas carbonis]
MPLCDGPRVYPRAVSDLRDDLGLDPVPGDGERPRRRLRERKVLLAVLGSLVALAVLVVGGAAVLAARLDANVERIEDPFEALPTRPAVPTPDEDAAEGTPGTPVNILVLGSDSRVSAGDPSQWEAGAQRTDVMMLVHLPADGGAGYVMSLPRDSWVDIPGHGQAKLNAAFSLGGPTLLLQTVEALTGVRVDHFAMADFESFVAITDALGGVRIDLQDDLVQRGELIASAGEQRLTGEQALVWVRQRKNLARGDFDRVQRHQAWIRAMVQQARDSGTLADPTRWYPLLDAVTNAVAVDPGLDRNRMIELLMRVRDVSGADLHFFTVPLDGTGTSADGQSIVVLDRPQFDALMTAVREDRVDEYLARNPDEVDRLPAQAP